MFEWSFFNGLCAGIIITLVPTCIILVRFRNKFRKLAEQFNQQEDYIVEHRIALDRAMILENASSTTIR
jgi:hypothetical protein